MEVKKEKEIYEAYLKGEDETVRLAIRKINSILQDFLEKIREKIFDFCSESAELPKNVLIASGKCFNPIHKLDFSSPILNKLIFIEKYELYARYQAYLDDRIQFPSFNQVHLVSSPDPSLFYVKYSPELLDLPGWFPLPFLPPSFSLSIYSILRSFPPSFPPSLPCSFSSPFFLLSIYSLLPFLLRFPSVPPSLPPLPYFGKAPSLTLSKSLKQ